MKKQGCEKAKTAKRIMISTILVLIILVISIFVAIYINTVNVYAVEVESYVPVINISNASQIDINEVIEENLNSNTKTEYFIKEEIVEYTTKYINNSQLAKGAYQVIQEGRQGLEEITYMNTYEEGVLVTEEKVNSKITKGTVQKIVEVGTNSYLSIYKAKIGDEIEVVSDRAELKISPDINSEKIVSLSKGDELEIIEILDTYYMVSHENKVGYVKIENTTNLTNQDSSNNVNQNTSSSDVQKINFGMSLNKPSGLSLEQFEKILTDGKDINGIFSENAKYFYYIEQQYNINGLFVAAVAIHESGWGTSQIANDKKNLFGYGAYDATPYDSAYTFDTYAEGIDLLARVFVKYYINPQGTQIYNGEIAVATYYNGPTLTGINTRYATDQNWDEKVYNHMEYLYNKL